MSNVTQNSSSPLLGLPNEIVVEITIASRPHERQLNDATLELPVEWSLSHVCRQLRQAVVGAAVVWTWVEIDLSRRGSVQRAQLYLQRSGSRQLRVTLLSPDDIQAEALDCFTPHLQRVSGLIVVFGTAQALDIIMDPIQGVALPNLVHLEIDNRAGQFSHLDLSTIHAPSLVFLRMIGCAPNFPPDSESPPQWISSLMHLELRKYTKPADDDPDQLAEFLTDQDVSMTHVFLEWDSEQPLDTRGNAIANDSFKHVRLKYEDDGKDTAVDLLLRFTASNLESLVIHGSHGSQIAALFSWEEDIQWFDEGEENTPDPRLCFPSLTLLVFDNSSACTGAEEEEDYKPILAPPVKHFPMLSSLALVNQCYTAKILLNTLGPNSKPWPLLETLFVWPPDADAEVVYAALQDVVGWKRSNQEAVPTFRLSPELYNRPYWTANDVQVELVFKPSDAYSADWY